MEFVVLVKVVPALEELRFDPGRFTVLREAGPLFLNPYDQRALRVALELRRPGERVRVLSMGPPSARGPLKEVLAHGADEATLLSDPQLAASDSLATARALVAAIRRAPHEVVLAGARTTDSETGQVPPEVAALLGVPILSSARTVARDGAGSGFEISVDTALGWATYRVRPPFVVSVGEKIAKPLKATPDAMTAIPEPSVGLLSLTGLGLPAAEVGAVGSPTWVESVAEDAPARHPEIFAHGSVEERVAGAVLALNARLARPREPPRPLGPVGGSGSAEREVLVLTTGPDGRCEGGALGAVSEVRRAWPGYRPSALWIGEPPTEADTYRLGLAGAVRGYYAPVDRPPVGSDGAATVVDRLLDRRAAVAAVLFLADPFGREVAGLLGGRRGLGLVGDATALGSDGRGLVLSKPSFGGRTVARIRTRTTPVLATVEPGAFAPAAGDGSTGGLGWEVLPPAPGPTRLELVGGGQDVAEGARPDGREVVIAVGLGIGGPEGIERLRPVAARWGAAIGATRRVVDAGWVPRQLQIGLTGRSIAPRLGILLGVGGSTNHLIGWQRAGTLLAVNRDPAARVFSGVDVGIVGEIDEVLPPLAGPLARAIGR